MAAGRDYVGVVHWAAFVAGLLLVAAANGDPRHLRDLLDPGVILACGMAIAMVIRWGFTRRFPGSVTPITDAPSALELACENNLRIEDLELRSDIQDDKMRTVARVLRTATAAPGSAPSDPDGTQPIPGLPLVLLPGGRESGGIQAGLCPVAGAPLPGLLRG